MRLKTSSFTFRESQMRIGITCFFQFSVFSNGSPTNTLSLADALKKLGHDVVLVNMHVEKKWYDDVGELKDLYEVTTFQDFDESRKLDVLIDIDGFIINTQRSRIANKVVIFMRKDVYLHEMECSVYPIVQPIRDLSGVNAVWHWDTHTKTDTRFLELLMSKPVFRIPYTWSPLHIDAYAKESGVPEWLDNSKKVPDDHVWEAHVMETNTSMTTNCTLPLVILANVKRSKILPIHRYAIHNADGIKENEFFKKNVLEHCEVPDLSHVFVGRQRCTDWRTHPKSFIISHQRFTVIKPALLDLAWNGIPVIHNSPYLRDIGWGLEKFYYEDNSISGATEAIRIMNNDYLSKSGFFLPGNLEGLRYEILKRMDPRNLGLDLWVKALDFLESDSSVDSLTSLNTVIKITPEKITPENTTSKLRIGFSDMWADFNPQYNFFTLLLETAGSSLKNRLSFVGVDATKEPCDLLVFGPFGSFWQTVNKNIPKVHFTGENTDPIKREDIFLNLGYKNTTDNDDGYIRLPLWILEVDWFGANREKIVNPKPLPIDRCCKVYPVEAEHKNKFCAFVVTNPMNPVRNNAFHWLSCYKQVDSAGRLFNNVGTEIFAGLGGGGGELKKHHFLRKYKFCLAYENKSDFGYCTEKWLHAKAAGCIPIYWGDPHINREYDSGGFLNANDCNNPESLIELVQKLDNDPEAYKKMLMTPALDDYRRDLIRRRLSELASRLIGKLGCSLDGMPRFLGATTDSEAAALRLAREGSVEPVVEEEWLGDSQIQTNYMKNPILVSYATQNYVPAVLHWIRSLFPQKTHNMAITMRVYLGEDVTDETIATLRENHNVVDWVRLPSTNVEGFPDVWHPQHFAWKLWVLQSMTNDPAIKGRLVWYFDAGCMFIRWPTAYLEKVSMNGVCFLEDPRQTNDQWCHDVFCAKLNVSDSERKRNQIWAGSLAFIAGHQTSVNLFNEAWTWGQDRDVIVGPKWSGTRNGLPYGHRHDQSILSVLSERYNVAKFPLDEVYCDESLRRTHQSGAAIYCHRGNFKVHVNVLDRISDIHIINLERRKDRLDRFKANHNSEPWTKKINIRPAVDGRELKMTPEIARLFAPNDFKWKKPILGCALSHLSLWHTLSKEQSVVENYLILEDDVKFTNGWTNEWADAAKHIPDDYDILYLGGVLPPNRGAFKNVLAPVNEYWGAVLPNQIFGQREPNTYFHFCNYSYILRKSAAIKILESINEAGGYFTSADHMICNQVKKLKHYCLMKQVAGCYQDDDPKYQTSAFNDFSRIDGFDSDLWNNDEKWTSEDLNALGPIPSEINIELAIHQAYTKAVTAPVSSTPCTLSTSSTVIYKTSLKTEAKHHFITVNPHVPNMPAFLEKKWLTTLFGKDISFTFSQVDLSDEPLDGEPIVLVQRPHVHLYEKLFEKYEAAKKGFRVLHLSDEFGNDNISYYSLEQCKGVIRNYGRKDIPDVLNSKVLTIPLGYAKHSESGIDAAWAETPSLPFREFTWSFHGTEWMSREAKLDPLKTLKPYSATFYKDWLDAKQLKEVEYVGILLNSIFVPCPRGQHPETFRVYEALEHGAIPIIVREEGDDKWYEMMQSKLPMINMTSWIQAYAIMKHLLENRDSLDKYRVALLAKWSEWKHELKGDVKRVFGL